MGPSKAFADFLAAQTTLTLATTDPDGSPYATDLFYVQAPDAALYFLSDPKTRHIHNLAREPRVSATIHGESKGWQEIRGIQLTGAAARVDDTAERARGYGLYVARYVFVGQWIRSAAMLGQVHKQLGVVELYKITPRRLRWIDNTQGFGHKEEWDVPPSGRE